MFFLKKKLVDEDGILFFPITDNKTKKVTNFYKITPFPNYKANDDRESILDKGNKNTLAKQFKKYIGNNKSILEVGCGTGQLSIYFALETNNKIVSLDPTLTSINLAKIFPKKTIFQIFHF